MQASAVDVAWAHTLSHISEIVGESRYNTWFKKTCALSCDDSHVVVGVPGVFVADWLERHYTELLSEAASTHFGHPVKVTLRVDPGLFVDKKRGEYEAKIDIMNDAVPDPARFEAGRYTLDNFVVGPCNSVAHAAAVRVAQGPGKTYNPFFVHGGVGLGKTHLLWGIVKAAREGGLRGPVEYVSAEAFTNRYVFAARHGLLDAFRARYRNVAILVIDDIHFIANKPGTQEEFLNTYKSLSRTGAQIVMACDSHPKLIGKLREELVTRFLSGMVARLEKPAYATRLEIAHRKAAERKLDLPPAVVEFVAGSVRGSVREIEGAVNTLAAYVRLSRSKLTTAIARVALKGLIESNCRPVRLPEIDSAVTQHGGLLEGDLRSRRRTRGISGARHLAMYLARQMGRFSYSEIGAYFGGRNHSTVVAAVSKILALVKSDPDFAREVAALRAEFGL